MHELLLGNDLLSICIVWARNGGHDLLLLGGLLLLLNHGGLAEVVCSDHLLLVVYHLVRSIGKRLHLHMLVRLGACATIGALLAVHAAVDTVLHGALVAVLVDCLRLVMVVDRVLGQDFLSRHVQALEEQIGLNSCDHVIFLL